MAYPLAETMEFVMLPLPRTALVTGAARRVGRQFALGLAQDGFDVAIHYHQSRDEAERLGDEIHSLGRRATLVQADLAQAQAVDRIIPQVVAALGPLGLLVNNASEFEPDEAEAMTRARFERHLSVNLTTPLFPQPGHGKSLAARCRRADRQFDRSAGVETYTAIFLLYLVENRPMDGDPYIGASARAAHSRQRHRTWSNAQRQSPTG